jgi:endogenous inhibitor of DNA gyrase (YacG/DUF329 family)
VAATGHAGGHPSAPPTAQQSACQQCGKPIVATRQHPRRRFCSTACRSRYQGAQFRQRKRAVKDSEAILHPGELQRPFRTDESEPDWLRDELKPPRLPCETVPDIRHGLTEAAADQLSNGSQNLETAAKSMVGR